MGTIYKRSNSKFWWIKYHRNGKQYFESTKSTLKGVADNFLKQREGEIAQGKLPGIQFDKVLFNNLLADLLKDYSVNQRKSEKHVKIVTDHLKSFFDGWRATDIGTSAINAYIEKRRTEGAANGTINRELAALKRMYSLGKKHVPPKVRDIPSITMLEEHNVRKGFFEHQQFLDLRDKLPRHLYGPVTFGYKYGFRKSEILGLTWGHIDREAWTLRLESEDTKNEEPRTVYLDMECRQIIDILWANRKNLPAVTPLVFTNRSGGLITDFRKSWATACKEAKIGPKLFHDLRRTAVRNMVRAGIPEKVAMAISGHKTRSVFDRYNIVSDDDLKKATDRIAEQTVTPDRYRAVTVLDFETKKKSKKCN